MEMVLLNDSTVADRSGVADNGSFAVNYVIPDYDPTLQLLQNVVRKVEVIYLPIMCLVGLLMNAFLVILLLYNKKLVSKTSYTILAGIAVVHSICLSIFVNDWATQTMGVTANHRVVGWCQFVVLVENTANFLGNWFILLLALNGVLMILFRRNLPAFRCKLTMIALSVGAVVVSLNVSLMQGVMMIGKNSICVSLPEFTELRRHLDVADAIVNTLFPSSVMVVSAALISCRLLKQDYRTGEKGELLLTASLCLIFGLLSLPSLYNRLDQRPKTLRGFLSARLAVGLGRLRYTSCGPLALLTDAAVRMAVVDRVRSLARSACVLARRIKCSSPKVKYAQATTVSTIDSSQPGDTLI